MKQEAQTTSYPLLSPLYPRLMASSWNEVDQTVRQAHLEGRLLCQAGVFRVQHGTSRLARLLLWILRMPTAAEAVATQLVIMPLGRGERWIRRFSDKTLVSVQAEGPSGMLTEHISIIELRFRLEVSDGALIYEQVGAGLRLGLLSFPLPSWLWPRVEAREQAEKADRTHVSVTVTIPLAGFLISYDGHIS